MRYALRLAAGFGSQISMLLLRWTPVPDGRRRNPDELGYAYRIADRDAWTAWLRRVSGYDEPQLEVVQHRLRVVDQGPAGRGLAGEPAEPPCRSAPRRRSQPAAHAPERRRSAQPDRRRRRSAPAPGRRARGSGCACAGRRGGG